MAVGNKLHKLEMGRRIEATARTTRHSISVQVIPGSSFYRSTQGSKVFCSECCIFDIRRTEFIVGRLDRKFVPGSCVRNLNHMYDWAIVYNNIFSVAADWAGIWVSFPSPAAISRAFVNCFDKSHTSSSRMSRVLDR
jgi:hypothetical protein